MPKDLRKLYATDGTTAQVEWYDTYGRVLFNAQTRVTNNTDADLTAGSLTAALSVLGGIKSSMKIAGLAGYFGLDGSNGVALAAARVVGESERSINAAGDINTVGVYCQNATPGVTSSPSGITAGGIVICNLKQVRFGDMDQDSLVVVVS